MNLWKKTKFDGVYIHIPSEQKKRPAKFYYCSQWRGKQVWRGSFTTAAQARDARIKMKAELMQTDGKLEARRMPVSTFGMMVEELVKSKDVRKTVAKTGRSRYSVLYAVGTDYSVFNLCFDYLRKHNRKHFADGVAVADFAEWMRQSGMSERTLEISLRLLYTVYGRAVSRGLYKINPVLKARENEILAARIRKRAQVRRHPAMRKTISPEDRSKICAVVKEWPDPRAVWVGLNVGMGLRPSVFNRLRMEDFSPSKGLVYIRPEIHKSKRYKESGKPTASFLPPEAYELLQDYAERLGLRFSRELGFLDSQGKPASGPFLLRPKERSNMRQMWCRILRRAGVEYAAPYAARHTTINEMLDAGVDVKDVATHSGNTPETIFRYYVKSSTDKQIQAIPEKLRAWRVA